MPSDQRVWGYVSEGKPPLPVSDENLAPSSDLIFKVESENGNRDICSNLYCNG